MFLVIIVFLVFKLKTKYLYIWFHEWIYADKL